MSLEGQSRRSVLFTESIVHGTVLISCGEVATYFKLIITRKIFRCPSCVAVRISIVAPLCSIFSAVEVAVEILKRR